MKFSKRTFANGLRVLVSPMTSTDTVTLLVYVGTGANYETKANNGISHFLEHMFFKGTKNFPQVGELDRMLDAVGAEHNAFTSREHTGYWIKVDASHFPLALTFVSEILQNALLKEEEINKERGVILEEMSMYRDSPQDHVWDLFSSAMYGDHAYGWEIIGTPQNIHKMKRSAFVNYWKSQYVASNTIVAVAGNISETATFSKIEQAFRDVRVGKPQKEVSPPKKKESPEARILQKNTAQTHLIVGVPGYSRTHKDRIAAGLLATIMGGYMSSRLFTEIRTKLGLAYYIVATHSAYKNVGHFAAYAGVPHSKAEEVAERIVANMIRVKKHGVTSEELSRAKENAKGRLAISLESTDDVAGFLGSQEILLGKIETPERVIRYIDAVTKNDIQRVAKSMFRPHAARVALVGPNAKASAYEAILAKLSA